MKLTEMLPPHGQVGHFCHGGCAGYAGGGVVTSDDKDPSHIPEDIKEYVKKAHKEKNESRPDENWRVKAPDKPESVAPYKKDEESMEATADEEVPAMAAGGEVPGYFGGVDVPDDQPPDVQDPNALLASLAPAGTGMIAPSPATPAVPHVAPPAPVTPATAQPVAAAPMAPAAPPAPTDQDFMTKANTMLGLDPQKQATFLKMLGDSAQKSQLGAGIAGIGDAIASGGTLGKVNPGNLGRSEDLIQNKTKQGIEGEEMIQGGREKAFDVAQKLQAQDPNSPLSKWAQKAYGSVGKKLGLDLSHASAGVIGDVSGKGVEALNTEYQAELKQTDLQIKQDQLEATIANQKAEREAAKAGNVQGAAKALADKGMFKSAIDMIPGTAGHAANKVLLKQAESGNYTPDVLSYAAKHGITPEQAQNVKDNRSGS